jgi:hypothetical protein
LSLPIPAFFSAKVNVSHFRKESLMATSLTDADGGRPASERCDNAEQFVLRRLGEVEETMKPAELADEYGCSPSHMRDALRSLRRAGAVRRVSRGKYVSADADHAAADGEKQDDSTKNDADGDGRLSPATNGETDETGLAGFTSGGRVSGGENEEPDSFSERLREQRERALGSGDQPDQEADQGSVEEEIGIPVKVAVGAVAVFGVIVLASIYFNNQSQPEREQEGREREGSNSGLMPEPEGGL